MVTLEIKDYAADLKKSKPYVSFDTKKVSAGLKITPEDVQVFPPLNTDIMFSEVVPTALKIPPTKAGAIAMKVPESFSLRSKISPVRTQGLCGSCWAFSVSECLNDLLMFKDGKDYKISTMYMLTCYPNCKNGNGCPQSDPKFPNSYMCGGGNPASLAKWVSENGTASQHCVDYSACLGSDKCNGASTQHFATPYTALNEIFPSCGCYVSNGKHARYFIKPNSVENNTIQNENPDLLDVNNLQLKIKEHIYEKGPCVAGYHVFSNFMNGMQGAPTYGNTFSSSLNPQGVYLDMIDYTTNTRMSALPKWVGSHAIIVVGWGTAKIDAALLDPAITKGKTGPVSVPYWECKNSWGDKWNDSGYFKIAMYPYNKFAQFEVSVKVDGKGSGGIITFEAGDITTDKPFPANDQKGFVKENAAFFQSDQATASLPVVSPSPKPSTPSQIQEKKSSPWATIITVAVVLGLVGAIVYMLRK